MAPKGQLPVWPVANVQAERPLTGLFLSAADAHAMLASMCLEQENFDRSQGDFKAALQLLERCPEASLATSVSVCIA